MSTKAYLLLEDEKQAFADFMKWDSGPQAFLYRKNPELLPRYRMSTMVRVMKRVGRNDRCPCGSGKKAKSCCDPKPAYKYEGT